VPGSSRGEPWLRAVWQEVLESLLVLQRLLFIFLLFAPVVASAPLALTLDFKRAEWLELLRKSLAAAGGCCWGLGLQRRFDVAGARRLVCRVVAAAA
jgi:aarF domain-containing kinase